MKNKTVLITGASSGIGLACAELFLQQGANCILCAKNKNKLDKVIENLKNKYPELSSNIFSAIFDVSKYDQVEEAINNIFNNILNNKNLSKIDILINNAGLAQGIDYIYQADITDINTMIDVNIKGVLFVSKLIIKHMLDHNSGHIVNIGSISGHQVYPGGTVYCSTKFAVNAISQGIKMEVHGTPIRVSEIDPGMVKTNYAVTRFKGDVDKAESIYQGMTPLSGSDVARAVLFCVQQPPHVNIGQIMINPTDQTASHMVRRD